MKRTISLLRKSFDKFKINLSTKNVLTEAATGNYVCTPILAALADASVTALAKESRFGSYSQIEEQIYSIAKELSIDSKVKIVKNLTDVDLPSVDVVTNTGFLRPLNLEIISKLKSDCVIPLMWEPWEFRPEELDIEACRIKGIKVYGTNESDPRLETMRYIGFTCLFFLLKEKRTPFSSNVLLIGCNKFTVPIHNLLIRNNYNVEVFDSSFNVSQKEIKKHDVIIVAEHINKRLILGENAEALINTVHLDENHLVIHIAGNIQVDTPKYKIYPDIPAKFGYMSYTTDFIDPTAVFDLHAAGLKVAEGMLSANKKNLSGISFKQHMESNYPALAFEDSLYW